ncbi:MAG: glycosyltransferase family 2 protein [Actinobacteria bacterium]|nr:glycosyltransferase family 2 protein [Actinomycetota bacterium]
MSDTPRVDIVVRTKNRPQFLARALDDILAQEYPHWQLIIVNDGGDPVQAEVARRPGLEGRFTLLDLPESLGRGGAVMPGIEAGHSPYIAIHDDDDTWHPQFLTRTIQHLQSTDDVAVSVRTEIVWETPALQETGREPFHPFMQEPTYFDLLRFNHVVPISLLYRRCVLDTIGFDQRLRSVSDWDVNLQLWGLGSVGFLNGEPLAYWHQRRSADGDAANSVIAEPESHQLHDRRVRDEALRQYVDVHGSGDLLFLAKYVEERMQEINGRLDRVQQRYDEISRLLRDR